MTARKFKQRGTAVRKCLAALVLIALPAGNVFGQEFQPNDGQYTPIGDVVLSPTSDYTPIGDVVDNLRGPDSIVTSHEMCGAASGGSLAFGMMGLVGLARTHRRGRRR